MLQLTVNGETRTVPEGSTLDALVERLGLGERRLAIELNLEVVPRSEYATRLLADGDRLEIVHAIGGG